jgi:hypothetical protein
VGCYGGFHVPSQEASYIRLFDIDRQYGMLRQADSVVYRAALIRMTMSWS